MPVPLLEWDAIAPTAVTDSDEDGLVVACNQDVFVVVNCDGILGEDRNCVVVDCFANAH